MKNTILILILSFLMSSNIQADNNKDYRDCVKEFYRFLFSENKVTIDKFSAIYTNASPNDEAWFLKSNGKFKGTESDFVKFEKKYYTSY